MTITKFISTKFRQTLQWPNLGVGVAIRGHKFRLTDDFDIRDLALHGVRIYLAHVPASVANFYVLDMQPPDLLIAVGNCDSMVFRDHVILNGQDGLGIHSKPCYLEKRKFFGGI